MSASAPPHLLNAARVAASGGSWHIHVFQEEGPAVKKQLIAVGAAAALAIAAVPAFGATKTVRVADNVFRPASTSIKRGDTVRFRWTGRAPHNVTRRSGPSFRTIGNRRRGTVRRRITRRGTYRLTCTIHPGMNLTLRVR
jgi:plastocyanin